MGRSYLSLATRGDRARSAAEAEHPRFFKGLVGAWSPCLHHLGGTTLFDGSTFRNHGTLTNGPTWTTSDGAGCLSFDGVDDYVDVGALPQLFNGISTVAKFSLWAKQTNPTAHNDSIVLGSDTVGSNHCRILVGNDDATNNHIQALYNSGTWPNNYAAVDSTATTITSGTWYHVVLVLNLGVLSSSKAFINGAEVASTTPTAGTPPTAYASLASNFNIGKFGSNNENGLIDDVLIYNRILTANDVNPLYSLGRGGWAQRRRRRVAYSFAEAAAARGNFLTLLNVA